MTADTYVEYAQLLRARGLRATGARIAILDEITRHPHADADAVASGVRAQIGSVSIQTVYDALRALGEVGLIRRIEPAGSPARYETRVGDNHHHLVCRICGSISDIDCETGPNPCLHPRTSQGFLIDEAEVTYWGRCPGCQDSDQ